MRRQFFVVLLLLASGLAGMALAQGTPRTFTEVSSIGQARPRGLVYDVNYDRIAWTDPLGRLVLVDARTFTTQQVLYESGFYNAYRFTRDGRFLAVAIDVRVDVWDTLNAEQVASFEPNGALRVEAPLYWSQSGDILAFNTQVRAPQAVRRSENDTTNLPWVWDVAAARDERRSVLPNRNDALPFFDYRNGFIYAQNNLALVGLPQRLQILNIASSGVAVTGEIPSERFDPDPITAWFSPTDDLLYVLPRGRNVLVQLNTQTGNSIDLPIGADLNYGRFGALEAMVLSGDAQPIGEPQQTVQNSLLALLLGEDYRARFNYNPLSVYLLDVLEPATATTDRSGLLYYVFDHGRNIGRLDFAQIPDVYTFDLDANATRLAVRRASTGNVELYQTRSGSLEQIIRPALADRDQNALLAFNAAGDALLVDYQRFAIPSGDLISEDLSYNYGFEQFFIDGESKRLVTLNGSEWWQWDINTGEIVRREQLDLRGELLRTSADGERFLTVFRDLNAPPDANGLPPITGYEVVEIGQDERPQVIFRQLENAPILDVIPSDDWEHYLVVHDVNAFSTHAPGNEIAVYNVDRGLLWHVAGDDLPFEDNRRYGWLDEAWLYVFSEDSGSFRAPQRIYGVDYAPNGLPACIVQNFPDTYEQWADLWERFTYRFSAERLNRLARDVCQADLQTAADVDAILLPTATPTRVRVTSTPSSIAGVPACLTQRFSREARQYAQDWRTITEGLPPDEIEALEELICRGLQSAGNDVQVDAPRNVQVMTLDIHTGERRFGPFIPFPEADPPRNLELVLERFRREFGFVNQAKLSDDGRYLAVRNNTQHIDIYGLNTTYDIIAAEATATEAQFEEATVPAVALFATPTSAFQRAGLARPTLTPTVTPTPPPTAEALLAQPQAAVETEICPFEQIFTPQTAPDFAATGRLLMNPIPQDRFGNALPDETIVLDLARGAWRYDDTLPNCGTQLCQLSYDGRWLLRTAGGVPLLSRPDGSAARVIVHDSIHLAEPISGFTWIDAHTLQYSYREWQAGERTPQSFSVRLNAETGDLSAPFERQNSISINELNTLNASTQPGLSNRWTIAVLEYATGRGTGQRYFTYDRETDTYAEFGRNDGNNLGGYIGEWHPFGAALFYRFDRSENWFVFDPANGTHSQLVRFYSGTWSRDGRYRVLWSSLSSAVISERLSAAERAGIAADDVLLPSILIWDWETGAVRRYCVPQNDNSLSNVPFSWSPDGRYVLFTLTLPQDANTPAAPTRTLILDTQTGAVTEIAQNLPQPYLWMPTEGGW